MPDEEAGELGLVDVLLDEFVERKGVVVDVGDDEVPDAEVSLEVATDEDVLLPAIPDELAVVAELPMRVGIGDSEARVLVAETDAVCRFGPGLAIEVAS